MREIFYDKALFIGRLDKDGNIYDKNKVIGYVKDGQVFDLKKNYIGFIDGLYIFHWKEGAVKTHLKRGGD
ncbi:MAG: hypothetical protein JSV92_01975 [archaeon]|nr:MAG: hypothetical protein JSV92_01975 [archaeon]